ncbi:MAG: DNA internalization-related competence protein ComEC/Rec2, partial [Fibrobacterota bacterium]
EIKAAHINGKPVNGALQAKLVTGEGRPPAYGDSVRLTGRVRLAMDQRNPGAFDYREYLASQGVFAVMSCYKPDAWDVTSSGHGNAFMRSVILPVRNWIRGVVDRYVGPLGYLLNGVLLGDRRELPEDLKQDFRNTGLMHILAVSGLNVAMLLLIVFQVLTALFVPYRVKILVSLALIWFYAGLTDMTPSVVRATLMGSVILGGWMFERKSFIYNSLALAALIILVFNPLDLFNVGFQLSFAATIGIVHIYPRLKEWVPESWTKNFAVRSLIDSLLLSIAATLATFPILAAVFNQLSLIGLVANLIVVPLSFALLGLGLLLIAFAWFPFLASAYGVSAHYVTWLINEFVRIFARVPYGFVECATPETVAVVFYLITLVALVNIRGRAWAFKCALFFPVLFLLIVYVRPWFVETPAACVTFLDVGQGDCAVIELADGKVFVVDGGPRDARFDSGERTVHPFLKARGIRSIDAIFYTHPDMDHLGGLLFLAGNIKVEKVFCAGHDESPLVHAFDSICAARRIPVQKLSAGARVSAGTEARFDVLYPFDTLAMGADNNASLVLRFVCGRYSMLLTGDITEQDEAFLAVGVDSLRSDLLKVPHHGSKWSSSECLLNTVAPDDAVVQVGAYNRYGHPNPETVLRYLSRGIRLHRTDREGAITALLYNDHIEIKGHLGPDRAGFASYF